MNTGQMVSAVLHAGLILWVMLFDLFSAPEDRMIPQVTEVAIISGTEFEAMSAASPPPPVAAPAPEPSPEPVAENPPVPEPAPVTAPPPAPVALPEPATQPTPPAPEAPPPAAVIAPTQAPEASLRPQQRARVERVAPEAAPEAPPEVQPVPREQVAAVPDPDPRPDTPPERDATAPPAAATETVTEATEINPDEPARRTATAPEVSLRPVQRPQRPTPPVQTPPQTPPQTATAPAQPAQPARPAEPARQTPPAESAGPSADAIADALAQAMSSGAADAEAAGIGQSEIDMLRLSIESCWNVGLLSTDALQSVVTIGFEMTRDARPVEGSFRLVSASGGTPVGQQQAFQEGQRAILTCGQSGYGLPPDLHDLWRQVEITFNPARMSLR